MDSSQILPGPNNLTFVEGLYDDFLRDPNSVPADWKEYFTSIGNGEAGTYRGRSRHPSYKCRSIFNPASERQIEHVSSTGAAIGDRVYLLIRLYRVRGHRIAKVDPLGRTVETPRELTPEFFGFTEADMDQPV